MREAFGGVELARHAEGILSEGEQRILVWDKPPRTRSAIRWSAADAVLLDELADLVHRTPSLGHVVLDEAQDLSPMQLRAVGRRCSTGAATVLGDIAQGTTPWATDSWDVALSHLGKPDGHIEVLDRGFRVPGAVIDFAARWRPTAVLPVPGAPWTQTVRVGSARTISSCSGWIVATMSRIGPTRGRSISRCRMALDCILSVASCRCSSSYAVSRPRSTPYRRRRRTPIGSVRLAR